MKIVRLGNVINLKRGYDLPAKSRVAGKYPVISSSGVSGFHNGYKVDGQGVVTGRYGTLGEVYFVDGRYWPHNTALYVDDFKGNDPLYIYYLLKLLGAIRTSDKSAVPGVNRNEMHEMSIPVIVDTNEQIRIRDILRIIDRKIGINSKINMELESLAQSLYRYWFVQFEFPDANNRPYKTAGGAMVYNEELKREIPADWQVETLYKNALTEIIKPKINVFSGHKIYLDTSTVNDLSIGVGEQITYSNRASRANMQPVANSVWFAKMQSSVKHVIVGKWSKDLIDSSILSTGFMGLAVKEHVLAYITGYIRNPYFEIIKDSNSHGATMAGIGNDDMKNIKLMVPPENVLREFSKSTGTLWRQIDKNRQENQQLVELRDWLLPMLMNGQVEVG